MHENKEGRMNYYLISTHATPQFYKADGTLMTVDLNYVKEKVFSFLTAEGKLQHLNIGSSSAIVDNIWMVDSVEKAVIELKNNDIYPFDSKNAAKLHAQRLMLRSYKYLPVSLVSVSN